MGEVWVDGARGGESEEGTPGGGQEEGRQRRRAGRGEHEENRMVFSSRRRHTRYWRDWSSDVCSSERVEDQAVDLAQKGGELVARGLDPEVHRVGYGEPPAPGLPQHLALHLRAAVGQEQERRDRTSVVSGKSVDLGGRRIIKQNRTAAI